MSGMPKGVKMRIIHALWIVIILVISSCGLGDEPTHPLCIEGGKIIHSPAEEICENITTFHGNTTGINKNWYVLKFSSSSSIYVEEFYANFSYKCNNSRVDWCGYVFTNSTYIDFEATITEKLNESERFFHIHVGPFNYTSNRLARYSIDSRTIKMWIQNFTLPPGTWYLICFAGETVRSKIEIWFNSSANMDFLTTEGNDTFVLLPEDFLGNVNIKFGNYTVGVLNGRKTVKIDNTFVGIHYSISGWGFERFQYTDPDGNTEKFLRLFLANHKTTFGNTTQCIIGKEGTWDFRVDLLMFGGTFTNKYFCPGFGMSLFGADVELP